MERIHADTQYTYAPYNAYWGDYYTIQGDGAAAGQTAQDDVFLYYPRDTAQTQLEARADADPSVLDLSLIHIYTAGRRRYGRSKQGRAGQTANGKHHLDGHAGGRPCAD